LNVISDVLSAVKSKIFDVLSAVDKNILYICTWKETVCEYYL